MDWNILFPAQLLRCQVSVLRPSGLKCWAQEYTVRYIRVSVLRPSGLKYLIGSIKGISGGSRSCDRVDWNNWRLNRRKKKVVSVLRPSGLKFLYWYLLPQLQGLGLATEWIEIICQCLSEKGRESLGLATEWIEIAHCRNNMLCAGSRSCDRVDWNTFSTVYCIHFPVSVLRPSGLKYSNYQLRGIPYVVSVLRPSGLKYNNMDTQTALHQSRSCDRVDWNIITSEGSGRFTRLGLATEWIEILLSKQH